MSNSVYVFVSLRYISSTAIANATNYVAELRLIDLASFSSVRSFVAELRDDPVDIMVANAGVATREYGSTDDGWEQT